MSEPRASYENELLQALADAFAERWRRGEHPSIAEYADRHPRLAERIRAVLGAVAQLEGLRSVSIPAAERGSVSDRAPRADPSAKLASAGGSGEGSAVTLSAVEAASPAWSLPTPSQGEISPQAGSPYELPPPVEGALHAPTVPSNAPEPFGPLAGIGTTSGSLANLQRIAGDSVGIQLPSRDDPPPPAVSSPAGAPHGDKYHISTAIGSGGMGTVLKAFDTDLRRWVAMKVARTDVSTSKERLGRFVEEAQICGQLEHPNIPPVHEMGLDSKGQIYFTMKLVKGRTLHEIARDLSLGRPEVRREFTPIRIAQLLQQAAMGVHYANVRGVVHRDLKPENIMVGDYGEVLVMDWGLAKVIGEDEAHYHGEDPVLTTRMESGAHTLAGVVQGTPSYMAPEQARGEVERIDGRTDVFGLGAVLYQLLCYHPPYVGRSVQEVLHLARIGAPQPPSRIAPKRSVIPTDLEAICMKALSGDKESRYADAREFQQDLQSYIEGTSDRERRRTQAQVHAAEGRKHLALYRELEDKRERCSAEAKHMAERISPHEPVDRKKALWTVQDQIEKLRVDSAQSFSRARAALDAAIQIDPSCQEARRVLADLYWDRFLEAEARRDARDAAFYRGLVEANDSGTFAVLLKGDGTFAVESSPVGAQVTIYRYREEHRILVPLEPMEAGRTPAGPVQLPMGSYLAILRKEGYRDTRYPFYLGRSENHRARIQLLTDAEIGADFVYVPAGEFLQGGDPESYGGFERSRMHVEDFFLSRFPVTLGQYCEFLNAQSAQGAAVDDHVLRQVDEVYVEQDAGGLWRPSRHVFDNPDLRRHCAPGSELRCPAFAVSWDSATTYAQWRSSLDGREYTLPPEDAWEKASRGADGRYHPWGDFFDWTFAKGGRSRQRNPQPEPVGSFPADESPYGVRDMAGTIREWTSSLFDERTGTRAVRGGSWNLQVERHFRCATRFGYNASSRVSTFGFRLYTKRRAPRA